jgi:hypothetical protein
MVFRQIQQELGHLSSGTVFIQIRNNDIGKFGVKHFPVESRDGMVPANSLGLSATQQSTFRQVAVDSLRHKAHWTHGEIQFEFALMQNRLCTSVQFESHYNMASLTGKS